MEFPTYLSLPVTQPTRLPEEYDFHDVRYTTGLVEHVVKRFTSPGDLVFDPFAGFGTTLIAAKDLSRQAFGVEIDESKVDYLRTYHGFGDELKHGDIRRLFLSKSFADIDLIMTSPPYMGREDVANALTGYRYAGSYVDYLDQLTSIFHSFTPILSDDAHIVVEVSNLKQENSITMLAWDIGQRLSDIFTFQGEIVICWTGSRIDRTDGLYNYGYDHSYCLVFSNQRMEL